ncbi:MAG: PQQ-binding-like beta-propeller repeat protein [Aureliella sp.]
MRRLVPVLFTLLSWGNPLQADQWPEFRGPHGDGHTTETNVPVHWSRTENVAWRTDLPGESWSSPVVWGDRVFVTTTLEEGKSCHLLAIDRPTGEIVWDKQIHEQDLRRKENRNSYATPTPAVDGERVYACFGDGTFVATDFEGNIVWSNADYPFYSQHGLGSSPILHNGLLIMARDGSSDGSSDGEDTKLGWQTPWDQSYLIALDTQTGKERWLAKRGLSRIAHGTPCIWEHAGRTQVISEAGDVVQGFDIDSGERLWSSRVDGEGKVPSTLVGHEMVFTAGGWGGKESIKAFQLGEVGELEEKNLVWEQKRGMPKIPSMLFAAPYLIAVTDGGIVSCMHAETGELQWQERLGGNYSASPVTAAGRIYITSDEAKTTVIELGDKPSIVAVNSLEEPLQASLAISQGSIFLRTEHALFRIGK